MAVVIVCQQPQGNHSDVQSIDGIDGAAGVEVGRSYTQHLAVERRGAILGDDLWEVLLGRQGGGIIGRD